MSFDGKDSYIRVDHFPYRGDTDLTVECRVTPLSKSFSSVFGNNEQGGVGLGISTEGTWAFIVGQEQEGSNPYAIAQATEPVKLGEVVHLAGVFDLGRRTVKLFVDGKLQATKEWKDPHKSSALPFWIGADPCPEAAKTSPLYRAFHGLVDELRVSSVARYSEDFAPASRFEKDGASLLLYHFDEGPGLKVYDFSGRHRFGGPHKVKWQEHKPALVAKTPSNSVKKPMNLVTDPVGEVVPLQPVEEWFKGREELTVSQDGRGQFKSIAEAVKALKPGQVVKVLDKGPYHEKGQIFSVPGDTVLVSLVGTRVEASEYAPFFQRGTDGRQPYCGWLLSNTGPFRLSGVSLDAIGEIPADANSFTVLSLQPQGKLICLDGSVAQNTKEKQGFG